MGKRVAKSVQSGKGAKSVTPKGTLAHSEPDTSGLLFNFEGVDSAKSNLTHSRIRSYLEGNYCSTSLHFLVPRTTERARKPPEGCMTVYRHQLMAGLRIPPHPLLGQLCNHYYLSPSQLAPNTFIIMNAFLTICHVVGVNYYLECFLSFCSLKRSSSDGFFYLEPISSGTNSLTLVTDLPTSYGVWKREYFFLAVEERWDIPCAWAESDVSALYAKPALIPGSEADEAFERIAEWWLSASESNTRWHLVPLPSKRLDEVTLRCCGVSRGWIHDSSIKTPDGWDGWEEGELSSLVLDLMNGSVAGAGAPRYLSVAFLLLAAYCSLTILLCCHLAEAKMGGGYEALLKKSRAAAEAMRKERAAKALARTSTTGGVVPLREVPLVSRPPPVPISSPVVPATKSPAESEEQPQLTRRKRLRKLSEQEPPPPPKVLVVEEDEVAEEESVYGGTSVDEDNAVTPSNSAVPSPRGTPGPGAGSSSSSWSVFPGDGPTTYTLPLLTGRSPRPRFLLVYVKCSNFIAPLQRILT